MTDNATAEGPESSTPAAPAGGTPDGPPMPEYKGAPLDAERGPGLGCFWIQVVLLVALLALTPLSVVWSAPSWLSAALLILSLVLLFFVGQTMIFLLRLVAADRRSRRRPLAATARKTVGMLEEKGGLTSLRFDVPAGIESKDALLSLYAEKLRFPDWFGHNWDALEDCLRDLSWLPEYSVDIVHADKPFAADPDAARIYADILVKAAAFWQGKAAHSLDIDLPSNENHAAPG